MPVDPDELRQSVEHLLAGVAASPPGHVAPLSADLSALMDGARPILGVDRVGILLLDEGLRLRVVASSDPTAAALEHAQERLGVGPGPDTVRTETTVVVTDLVGDDRYPALAELVREHGVHAVVSAPIWVNGTVAGNLNAFRASRHSWTTAEIDAIETYADVVATLLQFNASTLRHRALSGDVREAGG